MAEWNNRMSRYERLQIIEQDSVGEAWKCRDIQTQKNVTVRWIPAGNALPDEISREVSVLRNLDHANVARLLEVMETPNDGWYVVCDYLDYDVDSLINADESPIDPQVMKNLLFQMFRGLNYCHSQKVVHRNLNPQTVLYDRDTSTLKLADFSYAIRADAPLADFPTEVTSPPAYKAPEILLGKTYTSAVDVWSVGCIFAEIVARKPFFSGDSDDFVLAEILRNLDSPSVPKIISACLTVCGRDMLPPKCISDLAKVAPNLESEAIDLLSKMLRVKPSERITAAVALEHPYFKNVHRLLFSV